MKVQQEISVNGSGNASLSSSISSFPRWCLDILSVQTLAQASFSGTLPTSPITSQPLDLTTVSTGAYFPALQHNETLTVVPFSHKFLPCHGLQDCQLKCIFLTRPGANFLDSDLTNILQQKWTFCSMAWSFLLLQLHSLTCFPRLL